MGSYWLALVSVAVTQAVNIGIMWVKGRRQAKGDRISDLQEAQNTRFDDMNTRFDEARADSDKRFEDMNRRFDEARADSDKRFAEMNRRFDESREDMNRRFDEARADSDKKHDALVALIAAQGQEIKVLEIKFTEKLNAGLGDLRTEMHKGFRDHGERLARIETRLEFSHPIPDPDHTPADSEATVLPGPGRS